MLSFFSSRRNLDSPNPTLVGERGVGRVPIPTRVVLFIYTYLCSVEFYSYLLTVKSLTGYTLLVCVKYIVYELDRLYKL